MSPDINARMVALVSAAPGTLVFGLWLGFLIRDTDAPEGQLLLACWCGRSASSSSW
jgi:hypothetical protein